MDDIIIQGENLTKSYSNIQVLNNINITIKRNNFYSIIGSSGAGKSTLLHLLGLLDTPTTGEISIKGKETSRMSSNDIAKLRTSTLGYIFQSFLLNGSLTAYENIMLPMYVTDNTTKVMEERVTELLEMVGLNHRANHYPKELSGGEQQRVAIARALANNPECILADEPTGNLDSENEKNVFDIFEKLTHIGKSIVVITHNKDIIRYSDTSYHLRNGILEEMS